MNKLIIELNTNQIELVDNATINMLYNITKTIPEPLEEEEDLALLSGYIESDYSVQSLVEYLAGRVGLNGVIVRNQLGRFENLTINTNDSYLMEFEDPLVKNILVANWGGADGGFAELNTRVNNTKVTGVAGEISKDLMASIKNIGTVFQETNISSFDEFQYFLGSNFSFTGCANLLKIQLRGITSIPSYAFMNCSSLSLINIPSTVTSVGSRAFHSCSSLTNINILGNISRIETATFKNCSSLTSIIIPNTVTFIGEEAFNVCSSLTSISIPSNTTIGASAFQSCTNLTTITLNGPVSFIGNNIFNYCTGLTGIYLESIDDWFDSSFGNSVSNPLFNGHHLYVGDNEVTSIIIPDGTTTIKSFLFVGGSSITSVIIPNTVVSLNELCFRGCSNLTTIVIPNSVTNIKLSAFYDCSGLTSITLGNSITEIGVTCFANCTSLISCTIGNNITTIKSNAFQSCNNISSVYITDLDAWCSIDFENNVSNPLLNGGHLYLNGTEVSSITIPNTVTKISATFTGCLSITDVTLPSTITQIKGYAFDGCVNLASINIPNGVTSIGYCSFRNCKTLISITIPNSVTTISDIAFNGCERVQTVVLSNSLTTIGLRVFQNCKALSSIIIPNSVTTLLKYAFDGCTALLSVSILGSITSIEDNCFSRCTNMISFTINTIVPPTLGANVFANNDANLVIYVPSQSVEAYKAASGWSDYASRIQAIST